MQTVKVLAIVTDDFGRVHEDRLSNGSPVFSRDCPEYAVTTPGGEVIWVLPNHFKSKFGGNSPASVAKRRDQAERTAAIYQDDHEVLASCS